MRDSVRVCYCGCSYHLKRYTLKGKNEFDTLVLHGCVYRCCSWLWLFPAFSFPLHPLRPPPPVHCQGLSSVNKKLHWEGGKSGEIAIILSCSLYFFSQAFCWCTSKVGLISSSFLAVPLSPVLFREVPQALLGLQRTAVGREKAGETSHFQHLLTQSQDPTHNLYANNAQLGFGGSTGVPWKMFQRSSVIKSVITDRHPCSWLPVWLCNELLQRSILGLLTAHARRICWTMT